MTRSASLPWSYDKVIVIVIVVVIVVVIVIVTPLVL